MLSRDRAARELEIPPFKLLFVRSDLNEGTCHAPPYHCRSFPDDYAGNGQNADQIHARLRYQGIHAFVFWAKEKGYFDREGLDVQIDQGEGSAATITRIAAGAYDAGLGM